MNIWGCQDLLLIRHFIWCILHITGQGYANNSGHQASPSAKSMPVYMHIRTKKVMHGHGRLHRRSSSMREITTSKFIVRGSSTEELAAAQRARPKSTPLGSFQPVRC